jgi:myo-inositol-1(or 4)-monophosphatase
MQLEEERMSFKEVAIRAAKEAGEISRGCFREPIQVSFKARKDLVTVADVESEKKIVSIIRENFPDHGIVGEELPAHPSDSPYKWIIDPIDGTTNYVAGIPLFSVCIALCHSHDAVLAVIYDPLREELFCAEKDKGACLNGQRIAVNGTARLEDCVVSYCRNYHPTDEVVQSGLSVYERLLPNVRGMRQFGGSALDFCYVASGRLDATVSPFTDPRLEHPAGCLMVDEAGGKSTDFSGKAWDLESPNIVGTNGRIHSALLELLRE